MAVLGMCLCCLDGFAAQENRLDFSSVIGASHTQIVPLGIIPHRNLDIFVTQKASVGSNPRWPFCELEGLSPDGGLFYLMNRESTPDRRAARPVAERR